MPAGNTRWFVQKQHPEDFLKVQDNPTSTGKITGTLNISQSTVFRIFKNQLLYAYHILR